MNLLLTRPQALSEDLANQVAQACPGKFTTTISPLLAIRQEPCSVDLTGAQAILFSSRQAVRVFAERSGERHLPALCVGDATAFDARQAGFSVQSADGDAAALALLAVQSYIPDAGFMLHFRGGHSTGDIVTALMAEGVNAEDRILYDQASLTFHAAARTLLCGSAGVVAPILSPRSANIFVREYRAINGCAPLTVISMSNAITQNFAIAGTRILEIAKPRIDFVLRALQEL